MKNTLIRLLPAGALITTLASIAIAPAHGFDRATTQALQACHDYLWYEVPAFESLPEAAISVFPASIEGNTILVNWIVNWDDIRQAGTCTVIRGSVEGYDEF